jgi:poly(beta-D-mannuronate) lyase
LSIEDWLARLARASRSLFDDAGVKRNNHWYWFGLGLAAVSTATNDESMWEMARGVMQDAASSIDAQGMLPMELARGKRALHYHAFAVTPLVAMAELAAAKGEDWYAMNDSSLHRLVAITARGLVSPQPFAERTGVAQEVPVTAGGGWLQLYRDRFPARLPIRIPEVRVSHNWLGGDVRNLEKALRSRD